MDRNMFINKAKEVHGDKYDYSKVEYVNNKTKVCIICPEHGEFWQIPSSHINRSCGCPYCAGKNKTNNEYIEKVKKMHGDKYDLSEATATTRLSSFYVTCKKCGNRFKTNFNKLLIGQGCKYCNHRSYAYTTEEFIKKAMEIHGDKYDYSKVIYKNNKEKICIICPEHGEFWQTPYKHIGAKQGCPLCSKYHKLTKEEFIERAKKIHGNRFDYSKVNYINDSTKICIICPEHGEFWQTPHNHLNGKGCNKCHEENHINEMLLYNFLKNNLPNYNIVSQYKNKFLDGQILDIYIEELNIGVEYQGIQHFTPVKYFGGKEKYEYTIKMDRLKKEKCDSNNVKLFYFSKENKLPKEYLDTIYSNKDELLKEIKKYANN